MDFATLVPVVFGIALYIGMFIGAIAIIWHFRFAIVKTLGVIIVLGIVIAIVYFVGKFLLDNLKGDFVLDLVVFIAIAIAALTYWANSKE